MRPLYLAALIATLCCPLHASAAFDGLPVGEQQMIECLLLTNLQERCFQATLDCRWIITNQHVGYEAIVTTPNITRQLCNHAPLAILFLFLPTRRVV